MSSLPESNPLLSILIVNYNGRHFLDDCLQAIRRLVSCTHEVVIVDNASQDGSCEYLRREFPEVVLIASEQNTGFTGGNNLGARRAKGQYLLLLNNDTKLLTDVLPAIEAMDHDPCLGVVGGRLFYGDGRQQPSIGYEHTPLRLFLSWIGLAFRPRMPSVFRRSVTDESEYDSYQPDVAWVSGAMLFTRTKLWQELGGLDETYFMYIEDVDFCKRVRLKGNKVAYLPEVKTVHYEGAGRPWIGQRALLNTVSSYLIYTKKYHGWVGLVFLKMCLGPVMLARGLFYTVSGLYGTSAVTVEKAKGFIAAGIKIVFGR